MRLLVGPGSAVEGLLAREQVDHILTLISPDGEAPRGDMPRTVLRFNDIAAPRPGLVAPSEETVAAILALKGVPAPCGAVQLPMSAPDSNVAAVNAALAKLEKSGDMDKWKEQYLGPNGVDPAQPRADDVPVTRPWMQTFVTPPHNRSSRAPNLRPTRSILG